MWPSQLIDVVSRMPGVSGFLTRRLGNDLCKPWGREVGENPEVYVQRVWSVALNCSTYDNKVILCLWFPFNLSPRFKSSVPLPFRSWISVRSTKVLRTAIGDPKWSHVSLCTCRLVNREAPLFRTVRRSDHNNFVTLFGGTGGVWRGDPGHWWIMFDGEGRTSSKGVESVNHSGPVSFGR